jgi:hypothetical protein
MTAEIDRLSRETCEEVFLPSEPKWVGRARRIFAELRKVEEPEPEPEPEPDVPF